MLEAECRHTSTGCASVGCGYWDNRTYEHTHLGCARTLHENGVAIGTTIIRGWTLLQKGFIVEFFAYYEEEAFAYFGCQLRYVVFLIGPGGVPIATSYDVNEFLNRCTADFCELAILMSTLQHYRTTVLGNGTSGPATRVPGEGFVLG